jgi:hypothetical protein
MLRKITLAGVMAALLPAGSAAIPAQAETTGGMRPAVTGPSAAREVTRLYDGFEKPKAVGGWGSSINDRYRALSSWPTRGPVRRVSGKARDGSHVLRFEVVPKPKSFRSEVARTTVPMGSDYWYGFSINVPKQWKRDPKGSILAQWHALVTRKVDNYPVVSLYLINDSWQVRLNWNGKGDTSAGPGWHNKTFPVGPARKAVWTDWVVHAKWSYRSTGLLEVWHNGTKVISHHGPNEYVNQTGPYFKMGIYHPAWRHADAQIPPGATPLVSYADAVRFARNGSYRVVRPR